MTHEAFAELIAAGDADSLAVARDVAEENGWAMPHTSMSYVVFRSVIHRLAYVRHRSFLTSSSHRTMSFARAVSSATVRSVTSSKRDQYRAFYGVRSDRCRAHSSQSSRAKTW